LPHPRVDQTTSRPTSRGAGWKACRTQGSMDGHRWCRASKMAGQWMELKAFFKSTCSSSHPVLPCKVSANACTPIATTSQGLPLAKEVCRGRGRRRHSGPGTSPATNWPSARLLLFPRIALAAPARGSKATRSSSNPQCHLNCLAAVMDPLGDLISCILRQAATDGPRTRTQSRAAAPEAAAASPPASDQRPRQSEPSWPKGRRDGPSNS